MTQWLAPRPADLLLLVSSCKDPALESPGEPWGPGETWDQEETFLTVRILGRGNSATGNLEAALVSLPF